MSGTIFLEASELSIGEANGPAFVTIVRTGDLGGTATIEYGITSNSATAGSDYIGGSGTVTMAAGQARIEVPVQIINDGVSEATETFTFSIITVDSGSTLLFPRTARIDILDDENPIVDPPEPPVSLRFSVTEEAVVTGLGSPLAFEFAPHDESLLFIAEKGGAIKVFDLGTNSYRPDFIDLTAKVNDIQDRGLIDIAFHPNFPAEPYVYAFYVVDPPDSAGLGGNAGPDGGGNRYAHVVRITADPATGYTTAIPGSEVVIVGGAGQSLQDISGGGAIDSTSNFDLAESGRDAQTGEYVEDYIKVDSLSHAGGSLAFGPDGALYISTGDGTSFNAVDPRSASVQSLDSLSGKILRVDPITGQGLSDNPFVQPGDALDTNRSKVYQLGFRNPFSMGFDQDGHLFVTNTGWNSYEEIESGPPGANFGWPYYEGGDNGVLLRTPEYQDLPEAAAFYAAVASGAVTITPAFRAFSHASADPGFQIQAITGGDVVYSGSRYPAELQNAIFFTDIVDGEVFIVNANDRRELLQLYNTAGGPVHFSQGPDGYVYYADLFTGQIGRLLIEPVQPATLSVYGSATFDTASTTYTLTSGFYQAGTVMSAGRIDLRQDFAISFDAMFGATDGADGLAFVIHNDPLGSAAIGSLGSGMAVAGILNGLAIEFDTFWSSPELLTAGPPDIGNDHTGFLDTDSAFGTTPVDLGDIEDGQWHSVRVVWDAVVQRLSYSLDGVVVGTLDSDIASAFLGGSPFAYFGVGAGTGGLTNDHQVRFTGIDAVYEGAVVNRAPVAADDAAATLASAQVGVDVLANDGDLDGDALAIASVQSTAGVAGLSDLGAFVGVVGSGPTQSVSYDGSAVAQLRALAAGATVVDRFSYTIVDGNGGSASATATITVTGVNDAPTISSNGGGATAAISVAENTTAVTTLTAADPDTGQSLQYSILGSADAAQFTVNATTGVLRFAAAPDFETPGDTNRDNIYNVTVQVSDGAGGIDIQELAVTVTNVAGISKSSNAATITGTGEEDVLTGGAGSNTLSGLGGNDSLSGGAGADTLNGGAGNDTLNGGMGDDALKGENGDDTIAYSIGNGADAIDGGAGFDVLSILGDARNQTLDVVFNGTALTRFEGGTIVGVESVTADLMGGVDALTYAGTAAAVSVSLAARTASGFASIAGVEKVTGGSGGDTLTGDALDNTLAGGDGDDRITGAAGNDTLNGGAGSDRFVYAPGFGKDQITGFDANPSGGQDLIELSGFGISSANFTARVAITDVGTDTLVTIDGNSNQTILLVGIGNATTVTAADFWLA